MKTVTVEAVTKEQEDAYTDFINSVSIQIPHKGEFKETELEEDDRED